MFKRENGGGEHEISRCVAVDTLFVKDVRSKKLGADRIFISFHLSVSCSIVALLRCKQVGR